MRLRMLGVLLLLLPFALATPTSSAHAQVPSDAELNALASRFIQLHQAGQYSDALPLAEQYTAAIKTRRGENSPEYAAAMNNMAQILLALSRYAEAETLMRQAFAIFEKKYGPDHPDVAIDLSNLGQILQATNRLAEAEPLMRRALAIFEKTYGANHPKVAGLLGNLGTLLKMTNRLAEAEPLFRRALAIDEKAYGPNHQDVARDLASIGQLLFEINRLAEAEPMTRRALAIAEKAYGPEHPDVASILNSLASILKTTNQLAEAEALYRRALAIDEKVFGADHPDVARVLNNLGLLLSDTNRAVEAEQMYRRAITIDEAAYGSDHPSLAVDLLNLATLLFDTNQLAEAEPLYRRVLSIDEASYGPDHPDVARDLNNLAQYLQKLDQFAEAEPLYRRALASDEKTFGPDHPRVGTELANLASLLSETDRLAEAEPLLRRALAINEKSFGPDHPDVANDLGNLALLLREMNHPAEAEPLMRRALAIYEKAFGPDHPRVARSLNNLARILYDTNSVEAEALTRRALAVYEKAYGSDHPGVTTALSNLAVLREEKNDWIESAALCMRARPNIIGTRVVAATENRTLTKAMLSQNNGILRNCARALYRANQAANLDEGFSLAQWALHNAAADALNSMSVRFAKGDARLAQLVREEQDLLSARTAAYQRLDAAAGKADTGAVAVARADIGRIEGELGGKRSKLHSDFPEYVELANPQPLTIAQAQAHLSDTQALVVFLEAWQIGSLPGETLVFVVTKREARWLSIPLGRQALKKRVAALRCGLDATSWQRGHENHDICKEVLNTNAIQSELPPFDAQLAHTLYRDLFSGVEDLIKDKSLLIVASGPLTQLPFQVLITREPDKALPRFEAYKGAAWLGQSHAITVLPSVASLKELHIARTSEAKAPFHFDALVPGNAPLFFWAVLAANRLVPSVNPRHRGSFSIYH